MSRPAAPNPEQKRLDEANTYPRIWRKWGPYMSEREWGTVREDYSANSDAWNSFPRKHAPSRAYRWGEDGIGGLCDSRQRLCLAVALWNELSALEHDSNDLNRKGIPKGAEF